MQLIHSIDSLSSNLTASVLTLGNFDGVHLGHRALIRQLKEESHRQNATSIVITFQPHPTAVLKPSADFLAINDFSEIAEMISNLGIDILLVLEFTKNFSLTPPDRFLEKILVPRLHPRAIIIGHDHRFGHGRDGGRSNLEQFGTDNGIAIRVVEPVVIDGKTVSSSLIRTLILKGHLDPARRLLGRLFFITGTVEKGDERGTDLGYPTANLVLPHRVMPPEGVYASQATIRNESHPAITYIGASPTFGGKIVKVETHIFDFRQKLYGEQLKVELIRQIRSDMKFHGRDELIHQMEIDCRQAREFYELFFCSDPQSLGT
jgi:riboflavin kinase / FMN adenylyltransferase